MKRWTENEIEKLKSNYNLVTNDELRNLFPDRSNLSIYKKAYKLGLRKSEEIEFKNRSISKSGEKSPSWNGGFRKTSKGYIQILMHEHKRADSSGYVMEHIVVFEKESGIEIPKGCCVHHINGKKDDNRIENLCLMTHKAHTVFHHTGIKRNEETKKRISESKRK